MADDRVPPVGVPAPMPRGRYRARLSRGFPYGSRGTSRGLRAAQPKFPITRKDLMTSTLKLPTFPPQPMTAFERNEDGTVTIHLRPTAYGVAPGNLAIRLDGRTFELLLEHDCLLFGGRAGHLIVAANKNPGSTRRLHHLLTAAPVEYECLYRDGDAANVTVENIGFKTDGGYPYWLVPRDGEPDPHWNAEGRPMRAPEAISKRRPLTLGQRPAYTPTPRPGTRRDAEFRAAMAGARQQMTRH